MNEAQWENITTDGETQRLRVPNGWLYSRSSRFAIALAFVPDGLASTRQFTEEFDEKLG